MKVILHSDEDGTYTHTPGPWTVKKSTMGPGFDVQAFHPEAAKLPNATGMIGIASPAPFFNIAEQEANARLIAAAPDLLAVCGSILAAGLIECNCGSECDGTCTFSEIVRAVSKAEGK